MEKRRTLLMSAVGAAIGSGLSGKKRDPRVR